MGQELLGRTRAAKKRPSRKASGGPQSGGPCPHSKRLKPGKSRNVTSLAAGAAGPWDSPPVRKDRAIPWVTCCRLPSGPRQPSSSHRTLCRQILAPTRLPKVDQRTNYEICQWILSLHHPPARGNPRQLRSLGPRQPSGELNAAVKRVPAGLTRRDTRALGRCNLL